MEARRQTSPDSLAATTDTSDEMVGVDAALDYPLYNNLVPLVKGSGNPASIVGMYQNRKRSNRMS